MIMLLHSVMCGSNGQWRKPVPKCKPVLCQTPKNVRNGKASFGATTYGEVVIYKCKKGHFLLGPKNSTCTEIGIWEPPAPKCLPVDCGDLEPIAHGHVHYEVNFLMKFLLLYVFLEGKLLLAKIEHFPHLLSLSKY